MTKTLVCNTPLKVQASLAAADHLQLSPSCAWHQAVVTRQPGRWNSGGVLSRTFTAGILQRPRSPRVDAFWTTLRSAWMNIVICTKCLLPCHKWVGAVRACLQQALACMVCMCHAQSGTDR
eukprot:351134-Chlamydomonas_euryale.AAC.7